MRNLAHSYDVADLAVSELRRTLSLQLHDLVQRVKDRVRHVFRVSKITIFCEERTWFKEPHSCLSFYRVFGKNTHVSKLDAVDDGLEVMVSGWYQLDNGLRVDYKVLLLADLVNPVYDSDFINSSDFDTETALYKWSHFLWIEIICDHDDRSLKLVFFGQCDEGHDHFLTLSALKHVDAVNDQALRFLHIEVIVLNGAINTVVNLLHCGFLVYM